LTSRGPSPIPEGGSHSFVLRQATLFGGEALGKLCTIAAFAYLARALEPSDFGLVELSLSIVGFFVLGVENGLGPYGARQVALAPGSLSTLMPKVILLRAMFVAPAYVIILVLSSQYGTQGVGILAVYGLVVCLIPFFNQWVFQGLGLMHWVAAGTALRYLLFAGFVVIAVRPGADPRWVAGAEVLGAVGLAALTAVVLRWVLRVRLEWAGSLRGSVDLFKETWSLGASNLTMTLLWYAPILALGRFAGTEQVAWLAAALRVVLALNTFVSMYFFNMLPNLTREIAEGVHAWRLLVRRSLQTSMWPAFLVALGGVLGAPVVVRLLYGAKYDAAALPLQIVIWMIPLGWFSGNFRYSLIASGHQRAEFRVSAITGLVTPFLAVALVLRAQSAGAATALLLGGLIYAALILVACRRCIGSFSVIRAIWRPALSCTGCLVLGLMASAAAGHAVGTAIGCLVYGAVALAQENELTQMLGAQVRRLARAS
jgi:O-antigen/teichoic acid export membrane protein